MANVESLTDLEGTALDRKTDDELKALVETAQAILKGREEERQKSAQAEIKRIAREHGLAVSISPAEKKRRGRPRKTPDKPE